MYLIDTVHYSFAHCLLVLNRKAVKIYRYIRKILYLHYLFRKVSRVSVYFPLEEKEILAMIGCSSHHNHSALVKRVMFEKFVTARPGNGIQVSENMARYLNHSSNSALQRVTQNRHFLTEYKM